MNAILLSVVMLNVTGPEIYPISFSFSIGFFSLLLMLFPFKNIGTKLKKEMFYNFCSDICKLQINRLKVHLHWRDFVAKTQEPATVAVLAFKSQSYPIFFK
jgi:hypothetical protein